MGPIARYPGRRAGVGKHTINRRRPSMAALLLDALGRVWTGDLDHPDTGDVRADLRGQFLRCVRVLSGPPAGPVHRAALYERFPVAVERRALDRITRAQRAGELGPDAPLERAAEALCGALFSRHLLSTRAVDEEAVDGQLDVFMAAYGTAGRAGRAGGVPPGVTAGGAGRTGTAGRGSERRTVVPATRGRGRLPGRVRLVS